MNNSIIKKIKQLKHITPRARFAEDLKNILLSNLQQPIPAARFSIRESLTSGVTIALAAAFVVLLVVGGTYFEKFTGPLFLPGLHEEGLSNELDNLNIQIKLTEAEYYQDAPASVSTILNETGNNTPNHLNNTLIQKESRILDVENPTNQKIDDTLNQLL